jgi:rhamnulokinase
MKRYNFLAFDVGATSGRAVLASLCGDDFTMKEIYRFPNAIYGLQGKYYWNVYNIFDHFKKALSVCGKEHIQLDSIGIDTWGVDFGLLAEDGTLLGLPRAYRDPYTTGIPEKVFRSVSRDEVYSRTGIQVMNFNSLYQLYAQKEEGFAPYKYAKDLLFMPDLLSYLCTGKKVCEYTIASTSQILNPKTRQLDEELMRQLGIHSNLFPQMVQPGTRVGELSTDIAEETGVGQVPVIAVAGHDTASAIVAVPATDPHFAYLSSGTWSLMGIESEEPIISEASSKYNYTNEGGVEGTTRFLKNITGMWLLEQCRKRWSKEGHDYSYSQIEAMATAEKDFPSIVNPDDPRFASPCDMAESIAGYCKESGQKVPESDAQFISCIYHSLAHRYKEVLTVLQQFAPFEIKTLHVIGGGSLNKFMSQLTADTIGLPVVTGPAEATAIGNALIQAKALGLLKDRWQIREVIAKAFSVETYYPKES